MNAANTLAQDQVWRRSPDVAYVDDGNRIVLLDVSDPGSSRPELLTGPAAAIWRMLDGATGRGIIDRVSSRFHADPSEVERDAGAFLSSLETRGLARCEPTLNRGGEPQGTVTGEET